jgi:hypothetical protein
LADGPLRFFSLTPCRLVDTRGPTGTNGGPALQHATPRTFDVQGLCGVPADAKAVVVNATVVTPTNHGWAVLYPAGVAQPLSSTLNFRAGDNAVANGAIVALAVTPGITVFVSLFQAGPSSNAHFVLDVTGYFMAVAP